MTTVAYLVNQYPTPTHTWIGREMAALEARGVTIHRITIRRPSTPVDDTDRERARTRVLLDAGALGLVAAVLRLALARPRALLDGLRAAIRLGRGGERGVPFHLIYLAEACLLREWLEDLGVDHVHAHFGTNPAAVALLCHRIGGPPFSMTVHGPDEFNRPERLKLGDKVAAARFAIGISSFGRSQLLRWSDPAHWDRVHVVRCGVDDRFLSHPHTPVPDNARFCSVGRLAPQKGQVILLDAVARLRDEGIDVQVVLVGDGDLRPVLERSIEERGLGDAVKLLGWRPNDDVVEEVLASRAFVLPSFAEGLPVVLMEALALGRPVIATAIAGVPELVEPDVSGWLVPPGSVDALADAMREVLETPVARLDEMGRAGAAAVAQRHDASREAAALHALLEESR